jgi:hypothetical protein
VACDPYADVITKNCFELLWIDEKPLVVRERPNAPAAFVTAICLFASNWHQLFCTSCRSESTLRICGKTIGDGRSSPSFGFG